MNPEELRYHKQHCWVRILGKKATIGITDYAQESLGDIVYVDLPEIDSTVEANEEFGEVESTKATSPLICPLSGTVVEVNEELSDAPEIINEDPYGNGWMIVVDMDNPSEVDELLTADEYEKYIQSEV